MRKHDAFLLTLVIAMTLNPAQTFAVGSGAFENASFSARSLAESNAVVAQPDEPAAISYNPAGIVDLPGLQVQANTAFISIFTRHSDGGNSTYSRGTLIPIPTAYLTLNPGDSLPGEILDDRLAIGVGMDAPFGLLTQYDSSHRIARYAGHANWMTMYAVKPTAAVRITDWLSLGAGPMYYRIMDIGQALQYPNALVVAGAADGQARANLRGHGWGWQMGALLKAHEKHQLGFYFRSPVTVHTGGLTKVERSLFTGNFEVGSTLKVDLPLNVTVGYAFMPSERTAVEVDFGFTRWRSFTQLAANTAPVSAADDAILATIGTSNRDYGNGFALHLGGNHRLKSLSEKLTLRAGSVFYWTPIHDVNFRPAVPDSNSLALSTGASYEVLKNVTVDAAYFARIWFPREVDSLVGENSALGTSSVDGNYFSFGQEFFLSLRYHWDDLFGPFTGKLDSKKNTLSEFLKT